MSARRGHRNPRGHNYTGVEMKDKYPADDPEQSGVHSEPARSDWEEEGDWGEGSGGKWTTILRLTDDRISPRVIRDIFENHDAQVLGIKPVTSNSPVRDIIVSGYREALRLGIEELRGAVQGEVRQMDL